MKKTIVILLALVLLFGIAGCNKKENAGMVFKEEYESLNGKTNMKGLEHRKLEIDENNPYEKVTPKELLEKIKNEETLYVYFGDKLCPWCRSVIEESIEVANKKGIKKIYYVNIWDDEGKEILRDKYEFVDGKLTKTIEGTKEYKEFLEIFDSLLSDYTITNADGKKVSTGEKRIYAPNFIYVEKGKVVKLVEGISEKQTDSREELTKEILQDEEKAFNEFFAN